MLAPHMPKHGSPYRSEAARGNTLKIEVVQVMEGYAAAYAEAQAALPDLAESPQPFRKVLASHCLHRKREIRYHREDWVHQTATYRLLIGINIPEQGSQIGLTPTPSGIGDKDPGGLTALPSGALARSPVSLLRCGRGVRAPDQVDVSRLPDLTRGSQILASRVRSLRGRGAVSNNRL
jgi:hypothetical protein